MNSNSIRRIVQFSVSVSVACLILLATNVSARIGVGVSTGTITIDEVLQSGARYQLPSFNVINTGTVTSEYGTRITYHEKQPEMMPDEGWFSLSPDSFTLEPGEAQMVEVAVTLPVAAKTGKYFAYLEAYPQETSSTEGGAQVGVAAASRLYFTVETSSVPIAIYNRLQSYYELYRTPVLFGGTVLILFGIISILRRFVDFNFSLKKKSSDDESTKDD